MKKVFFLKTAGIALLAALLVSCGGKDEDPTPTPPAEAKVFTSVVTQGTVADGLADVVGTVTISDGIAYLKLIGTSTDNIDHVYITTSQDNGAMTALIPTANYTDDKSNTFVAGGTSGASYTVGNTKNFTLIIPVNVRTSSSAVSDVYRIWFTNGNGAFTLPAKNLKLGPVTFTLNYVANAGASYSTKTGVVLGDQFNNNAGSLLVTSGQISALNTASYNDSPTSADISLSELNDGGTARTGALPTYTGGLQGTGALYFVSPSERAALGYADQPASPNMTKIATSSVDFDAATGATLTGLSVTGTKVKITDGGVYQFETAQGKKGLIKVTSLSAGTATVSVKVLN